MHLEAQLEDNDTCEQCCWCSPVTSENDKVKGVQGNQRPGLESEGKQRRGLESDGLESEGLESEGKQSEGLERPGLESEDP